MKKALGAMIVVTCLSASVIGCSVQNIEETEETKTDIITYGMVCDVDQIKEDAFSWSSWQGLEQAVKGEEAYEARYLESSGEQEILPNLEQLSDEGCTLIWGIGEALKEPIKESAKLDKSVSYVLMDYAPKEEARIPENVTYIDFSSEQASFLAGYAAGYATKTNQVGFVGGRKLQAVKKFEVGFTKGVEFAAKERKKEIMVQVEYIDNFEDSFYGEAAGETLIANECDVLFHAAGSSGLGVIKAVEKADCWAIGVDVDQLEEAPTAVLLSVLKNTKGVVTEVTKEVQKGTDIGGQTLRYSLENNGVGITKDNPNMEANYPGLYEKLMIVKEQIMDGKIVIKVEGIEGGAAW